MSKNGTAAGVTSALAGGLGLLYFKPAGAIINQDTFLDKLQACPITVEIEHRFEPEFSDLAPIPNLTVSTELRLSVAFNLENNDGLLEGAKAEVGLFKINTDPVKSFTLTAAPTEEPAADDGEGDLLVNFVTTSQVLASSTQSDSIDASKALGMLGMKDPDNGEALRSDQWFDKLGNEISKYARCTSFILEAGESVIVEPGAEEEAVQPPPTAAARTSPLRINVNENDDTAVAAKPITPSITREQLEQKREDRQGWMEEIRKRFRVANRVVYRIPLGALADHPEIEAVVQDLVAQTGEPYDVFLQRNITALVESAVVQIG